MRGVEQVALLEDLEALVYVALDAQDQCLGIEGVLRAPPRLLQDLIDQLDALIILLPDEKHVDQPVVLLLLVDK